MKKITKNIVYAALLFSVTTPTVQTKCNNCNDNSVITSFVPRSQGRDTAYIISGQVGKVDLFGRCSSYADFNIGIEYTRSFRPSAIADCLFGPFLIDHTGINTGNPCNDICNSASALLVQGSGVANRNAKALVAENFYLPLDFSSVVTFKPRIENVLINFDAYVGLDDLVDGLYVRFYGPLVHTGWDLHMNESLLATGTRPSLAGQYSETYIPRESLLANFSAYARGKTIDSDDGNGKYGGGPVAPQPVTPIEATIFDGLAYAQMFACTGAKATKNGFAELRAELGWNVWNGENSHIGFNVQMAFPTGPDINACRLFEPRIGNDKWQVGGGVTGHYTFWHSECDDARFGFCFDASVMHLFKGKESRVFDLKNNPLSRYLLAARFATAAQPLVGSTTPPVIDTFPFTTEAPVDPTAALWQFANELSPVANLTQRDVKVSIGAEADIVAWFNFSYNNVSLDIGYNFWGRTREKIHSPCTDNVCKSFVLDNADTKWGLRGNARIIGFLVTGTTAATVPNIPIRLSATQSAATINGVIPNAGNAGIDAPQFAFIGTGVNSGLSRLPNAASAADSIQTSIQPVFLTEEDIDYNTTTNGLSHKIFTHLQYTFDDKCGSPYLGIGCFGEFGSSKHRNCDNTTIVAATNANDCSNNSIRCALSQWGAWVKGGISFS